MPDRLAGKTPLQRLQEIQQRLSELNEALESAETASDFEEADVGRRSLLVQSKQLISEIEAETIAIAGTMQVIFPHAPHLLDATVQPACIAPHLYLGGQEEAEDVARLSALGISGIVNCAADVFEMRQLRFLYPPEWEYVAFPAADIEAYPLLAMHFDRFHAFADEARSNGRKLLVHCVAGANRSGTLCVAYLVSQGVPLLEAAEYIYRLRPIILTNPGFRRQLVDFARQKECELDIKLLPSEEELELQRSQAPPPTEILPKKDFDWSLYIM